MSASIQIFTIRRSSFTTHAAQRAAHCAERTYTLRPVLVLTYRYQVISEIYASGDAMRSSQSSDPARFSVLDLHFGLHDVR